MVELPVSIFRDITQDLLRPAQEERSQAPWDTLIQLRCARVRDYGNNTRPNCKTSGTIRFRLQNFDRPAASLWQRHGRVMGQMETLVRLFIQYPWFQVSEQPIRHSRRK